VKPFAFLSISKQNYSRVEIPEYLYEDLIELCRRHDEWFDNCRLNYLSENPDVDPNSDFSFPLTYVKLEIIYGPNQRLWHGDRDYEEIDETYTHYIFLDTPSLNANFTICKPENGSYYLLEVEEDCSSQL
jgi:hypothetical protein